VIPYVHIGSVTIPTFGPVVAVAMIAAYFVLRADLKRRGIAADAELLIAIPGLAGIAGAKLYHVLESPREFLADPAGLLFSRVGLAWFGGLIAGAAAFLLVGRLQKVPLLSLVDAGSPAAALGYGMGRIGCLLSGDGDYGIPTSLPWGMSFPQGFVPTTARVHPTPIYELIVACAIAWWLWRMGARSISAQPTPAQPGAGDDQSGEAGQAASAVEARGVAEDSGRGRETIRSNAAALLPGAVFAAYLMSTGLARFLVEFIRINPRSLFGLTNAQASSILSCAAGALLWRHLRTRRPRPVVEATGFQPGNNIAHP